MNESYVHTPAPIISHGLWRKTQAALADRNKGRGHRKKDQDLHFMGFLKCGHCGSAITGETKKGGRYRYYRCTGHNARLAGEKCPGMKGIREEVIADQLGEALRSIRLTPEIAALAIKGLQEAERNGEQLRASELARLTKRKQMLQRRLDQAFEAFIDGKVAEDLYKRKVAEWQEEQRQVGDHIKALGGGGQDCSPAVEKIIELASKASDLYAKQEMSEKRRLLNCVAAEAVSNSGKVSVRYRTPFNLLVELAAVKDGDPNGI